jgi:hypothetical protein
MDERSLFRTTAASRSTPGPRNCERPPRHARCVVPAVVPRSASWRAQAKKMCTALARSGSACLVCIVTKNDRSRVARCAQFDFPLRESRHACLRSEQTSGLTVYVSQLAPDETGAAASDGARARGRCRTLPFRGGGAAGEGGLGAPSVTSASPLRACFGPSRAGRRCERSRAVTRRSTSRAARGPVIAHARRLTRSPRVVTPKAVEGQSSVRPTRSQA